MPDGTAPRQDLAELLGQVLQAWTVPGRVHCAAQQRLREEWPTLATALDEVAELVQRWVQPLPDPDGDSSREDYPGTCIGCTGAEIMAGHRPDCPDRWTAAGMATTGNG